MKNLVLLAVFSVFAAVSFGEICNPLNKQCSPNVGLPESSYTIDFTQQSSIPPDWTISNWATVKFGSKGAEFTVAKRFEAPQLWTNFYIFYGRVEAAIQVAPGTGIISSAVLMSDDADEVDWEWSGNNFGDTRSSGKGQNNYFGKGITGDYDRGQSFDIVSPQTQFHTYTIDWTPEALTWYVDGKVIRTLYSANADTNTHQYPQTPSKFQLGIWAGGDPGNAWGTVNWAGGYTDFTKAPFTMYVKSVKITNYNPAYAYNWTDKSGSSNSIKLIKQPLLSSTSTSATTKPSTSSSSTTQPSTVTSTTQDSSKTTANPSKAPATCSAVPAPAPTQDGVIRGCTKWHVARTGDTCSTIASKYDVPIETIMQWNPAVDPPLCYNMWLNYGYCVSIDCEAADPSSVTSESSATGSVSSTSAQSTSASSSTIVVSSTPLPTTTITPSSSSSTDNVAISMPSKSSISSVSSSPTSSASSVPSTRFCPDVDGQSLTNTDSNTYTIKCASDSTRGSYSNALAAGSYLDCINACDAATAAGCTAWTYVGGSYGKGPGVCWLKEDSGTFVSAGANYISGARSTKDSSGSSFSQTRSPTASKDPSQTTTGATKTSSTTLISSSTDLCPEPSSQSFVASNNGAIYSIRCSSDTNIGSYTNTRASKSYADCMDACDNSQGCLAFTYVGGNKGKGTGTCWLKSLKGSAVPAGPNFVAGFLATKGPSTGASTQGSTSSKIVVSPALLPTTTISPTSSFGTSSSSTASVACATNFAGSNYTIYRSSDSNWGAYANAAASKSYFDCMTACDNDGKCKAFTYVGGKDGKGSGTCWLKSQLGLPVPAKDNVLSGLRLSKNLKVRQAVSSWWNSVTSVTNEVTDTQTQKTATSRPISPPIPQWARGYPQGGRWMWNGHGGWDWAWN